MVLELHLIQHAKVALRVNTFGESLATLSVTDLRGTTASAIENDKQEAENENSDV